MKTSAQLLAELNAAVVSGSTGQQTTAAGLRQFLTSLVAEVLARDTANLPQPRVQVRRMPPIVAPVPVPGILSTRNAVRLLFDGPLAPGVLAANPEIWLFTYNQRRRKGNNLRKNSWGHTSHFNGSRYTGAFWGGVSAHNTATEFFGTTLQASLALPRPYADVALDGGAWFVGGSAPARAMGKRGFVRRFRFALVVDAPDTPSGKQLGPLSDEIWLSSRGTDGMCFFQAPVYRSNR